jgi:hypothetical protein
MKRKLGWLALVAALALPAMAWAAEGAEGEAAEHPCCCCQKSCPR